MNVNTEVIKIKILFYLCMKHPTVVKSRVFQSPQIAEQATNKYFLYKLNK